MQIEIAQITERVGVRSIKPSGIERLRKKIAEVGYLPEKPVLVSPNDGQDSFTLVDGNHRVAALEELGVLTVEALVDDTLITRAQQLRRARLANEVAETVVPTTFVDNAELVWRLSNGSEKMTQDEIGGVLGWERGKVSLYAMLKKIDAEAWILIATHTNQNVALFENGNVAENATLVAFSEGLLRSILSLTPAQQLYLVNELITNKDFTKKKFNGLAQAYKERNEIREYVTAKLEAVSKEFLEPRLEEIDKGAYDKDWAVADRPKISKLIESIRAEWEKKSGTRLVLGDFNIEVLTIEDGIVDLVLTDPPYNISDQGKVTKQGSNIVNASFDADDDWDTVNPEEFSDRLKSWAGQWARVVHEGGAVISFCDKVLISDLWRTFAEVGLIPKAIIIWKKDNPSPAGLSRRNLVSSVEFMLWAVKPGASYTFNKCSTGWERYNVIEAPTCAGKERIKDAKGETLHTTQKPLKVLLPLVEVFSNRGDLVLDGFAGVGSTGEAAAMLNRKFVGVEWNKDYFNAMSRRLD